MTLSATTFGEGRGGRWWLQQPTAAIPNLVFQRGEADDGQVKMIVVLNNRVASHKRREFDEARISASVAAGVLTINPISLTDGASRVTVNVAPSTLRSNLLNSTFVAQGTASIRIADVVTNVPVIVSGAISQRKAKYSLRAEVRGSQSTTNGANAVTHTIFRLELEAQAHVGRRR
jgi:hypothetical protein